MTWKLEECKVCHQKTFVDDKNFSKSELDNFICHECKNKEDREKELKDKLDRSKQEWTRCSQCRRLFRIDPENPDIILCYSCKKIKHKMIE